MYGLISTHSYRIGNKGQFHNHESEVDTLYLEYPSKYSGDQSFWYCDPSCIETSIPALLSPRHCSYKHRDSLLSYLFFSQERIVNAVVTHERGIVIL